MRCPGSDRNVHPACDDSGEGETLSRDDRERPHPRERTPTTEIVLGTATPVRETVSGVRRRSSPVGTVILWTKFYGRSRRCIRYMADLIQRTAEGIDDLSRAVWDDSSQFEKAIVAVFLIVTGLAIPVVPIVMVARYVAN